MSEIPFVLAFSLYNMLTSIVLLIQSYNCSWGGWWFLDHSVFVLCWCSNTFFFPMLLLQPFLDIVLYIFKLTSAIGAQVN